MHPRAHSWFTGVWLCLGLLGGLTAWVAPRCLVLCEACLVGVPEPEPWHAWPLVGAEVALGGACPGGDVSRAAWDGALGFRHDEGSGIFVVFGPPRADQSPRERFLGAFRRESGPRLAFTSLRGVACCGTLGLAMAILIVGLGAARRRIRAASVLSDGLRGADLAVTGGAPSYRRAPPSHRPRFDAPTTEGADLAIRALRAALLAAAVLFAVFTVGVGASLAGW